MPDRYETERPVLVIAVLVMCMSQFMCLRVLEVYGSGIDPHIAILFLFLLGQCVSK